MIQEYLFMDDTQRAAVENYQPDNRTLIRPLILLMSLSQSSIVNPS